LLSFSLFLNLALAERRRIVVDCRGCARCCSLRVGGWLLLELAAALLLGHWRASSCTIVPPLAQLTQIT
jgi:hypothetical protein